MAEIICNTSPLQYLYRLGTLEVFHAVAGRIVVPPAVVDEIAAGKRLGLDLPDLAVLDWVTTRGPVGIAAIGSFTGLGAGESEVLMLALESPGAVAVLDDALARRFAQRIGVKFTGTLGILLDAKRIGLVAALAPLMDRLHQTGFRLSPQTRAAVLRHAGEGTSEPG